MAFVDAGSTHDFSGSDKTANQASTSVLFQSGQTYPIGMLLVVALAIDNSQTTDGDEGAVTSMVTQQDAYPFTKAAEFTNGQGAAQAGTTCSVWYTTLVRPLNGSLESAIASLTNSTSRDASCMILHGFFMGENCRAVSVGTPQTLANDAADPGSMTLGGFTSAANRLWFRAIALESNTTTALTVTDGTWTGAQFNNTSGGSAATNQAIRGEYKIANSTSETSNPTVVAADCASVLVCFEELYVRPPQGRDRPRVIHLRRRNR